MGSFNVGCGISNLSIDEGNKIGLVLLNPAKKYPNEEMIDGGKLYRIYTTDDYIPYLPPIFGEYGDYGSIVNIQPSETTALLERIYDRPIQDIVNCVGSNSGAYNSYGGEFSLYASSPVIPSYQRKETIVEGLIRMGFTERTDTSGVAVAYEFNGYLLALQDKVWNLIDSKGRVRALNHSDYQPDIDRLLSMFGDITCVYPGAEEENWERIHSLHRMSGMYFLSDVLDAVKAQSTRDSSYPTKNWKDLMQEIDMFEMISKSDNADLQEGLQLFKDYMTLHRLYKDISLEPKNVPLLKLYSDESEYLVLHSLLCAMTDVNRLVQPSFNGQQFGDTDASLALNKVTNKILRARKKNEEDLDY